jgi:hypothetical protein
MADDASAASSSFQAYNCYPIAGNDTLKVLNGDPVKLIGKLKKYYNKSTAKYIIEIERGNAEFISKVDGDHSVVVKTQEITIAKALEIGAALADNASTEEMYIMTGYVSAINVKASDAWSDNYKNQSFWVTDEAGSTASTNADGAFYVYRGKPETEAEIPVGTKVQFTATIKKYVPSGGGDPVIENADQNIVIRILGDTQAEPDVFFAETDFAGMGRAATLETPGDTVKLTKGGVTFFCDNAYGTDKYGVRCYKGATVSISVEDTTIAKIVFDLYSTYTGGLDAEVVVNGKEWKVVDLPSQARMTTIKVYYGHAEEIEIEEINIAEAMEIGGKLEDNAYTDKKYAVVGYVINAKNYGEKYEGKQTFYMSDEASAEKGEFTAYNCAVETPGVAAGDKVRVLGKIQKYVGASGTPTIEITGGDVEIMWRQGIENIVLTEKAQKVVVDGVLYIIRDNKMFNIQGIQVR